MAGEVVRYETAGMRVGRKTEAPGFTGKSGLGRWDWPLVSPQTSEEKVDESREGVPQVMFSSRAALFQKMSST